MPAKKTVRKRLATIRALKDLKPDPLNANNGTDRGREMLDWSLGELGAGRSIAADAQGIVLAGNKTFEAAKAHGLKLRVVQTAGDELVVVQRTDLDLSGSDEERARARQLALADNRISEINYAVNAEALLTHAASVDVAPLYSESEIEALRGAMTPPNVEFKESDESVEKDVRYIECPECHHKWPA
jgi:hypothetical protein